MIRLLKSLLWYHGLLFLLLVFNIFPLYTAIAYESPLLDYEGNLFPAIFYQGTALLLIFLGYNYNFIKVEEQIIPEQIYVSKSYYYFLLFLSVFGAAVALINITMFTSVGDLKDMMIAGDDVTSLREEAGAGGLGGVFKMFSSVPLFSFLATSSLLLFFKYDDVTKNLLKKTFLVSLICTFVKVLLVFDRLSILAVLIVYMYNYLFNKSFPGLLKIITIVFLLLFVAFLTLLRMSDVGLVGFLGTYFNLGVVNLQINIDNQQYFNYDFTQTFLMPLSFIGKFFGFSIPTYEPEDFCWNPAQSFWGFFFIDFNWIGLFLFPLFGILLKYIESVKFRKPSIMMLYFVFAYATFSFVTIPIIRSIEFWLMIVISVFLSKCHLVKIIN